MSRGEVGEKEERRRIEVYVELCAIQTVRVQLANLGFLLLTERCEIPEPEEHHYLWSTIGAC